MGGREGGGRREEEGEGEVGTFRASCWQLRAFFRYTRRRFECTHGSVLNLSTEGFFRESSHATHTTTHTHTTPQHNTPHTHNTAQPSTDHDPANVIANKFCNICDDCNFMRIYCFGISLIFVTVIIFLKMETAEQWLEQE